MRLADDISSTIEERVTLLPLLLFRGDKVKKKTSVFGENVLVFLF